MVIIIIKTITIINIIIMMRIKTITTAIMIMIIIVKTIRKTITKMIVIMTTMAVIKGTINLHWDGGGGKSQMKVSRRPNQSKISQSVSV